MSSETVSRSFPGFSSVYCLGEPGHSKYFRVKLELSNTDPFLVTRAEAKLPTAVRAHWTMGAKTPVDIIRTGFVAPLLVSETVIEILKQFVGWQTYAVEVLDKEGRRITGYHGLAIHGRCGTIDYNKSIAVPKQFRGGVFPVYKGLFFDSEKWDGSDIFMAEGKTGFVFVVRELKEAFEKAKIKNVRFTRVDQFERLQP